MQREALFNKSERQVAESQLAKVQQQLAELQAQSSHIQELHKNVQDSQGLVKEKDRKVRSDVHVDHLLLKQYEPKRRVCICPDNGAVQRGVPAEGGPRSSVTAARHHVHVFLIHPSWQPWAANGPAEQDLYTQPAASGGEKSDTTPTTYISK